MKNPATLSHNEFNSFTSFLKRAIASGTCPKVRLRNQLVITVECDNQGRFFSHSSYGTYCWYNDGHSMQLSSMDIIELVDPNVNLEDNLKERIATLELTIEKQELQMREVLTSLSQIMESMK